MKYLLLLKSRANPFFKKEIFKKNFFNTLDGFFIVFFLAVAACVTIFYCIYEKSQSLGCLEKKIWRYEKMAQELKSSYDLATAHVSIENNLEQLLVQDSKNLAAELLENPWQEVVKKRQEPLKFAGLNLIKHEKQNSTTTKEIEYRLSAPVEISIQQLKDILDRVEASKAEEKFFLKFSLSQQEIAKGYPTLLIDFALLTRVKS